MTQLGRCRRTDAAPGELGPKDYLALRQLRLGEADCHVLGGQKRTKKLLDRKLIEPVESRTNYRVFRLTEAGRAALSSWSLRS